MLKIKLLINLAFLLVWALTLVYSEDTRLIILISWAFFAVPYFFYLFFYVTFKQLITGRSTLPYTVELFREEKPFKELTISYIYAKSVFLKPFAATRTAWVWLHCYLAGERRPKNANWKFLFIYPLNIISLIVFHVALVYVLNILIVLKYLILPGATESDYLLELSKLYPGSVKTWDGYPVTVSFIDIKGKVHFW